MIEADPLKQLAIRFAQLNTDDQSWLLSQLSVSQRDYFNDLMHELQQIGVMSYIHEYKMTEITQPIIQEKNNREKEIPLVFESCIVWASIYVLDMSNINQFNICDEKKLKIKNFNQQYIIPNKLQEAIFDFQYGILEMDL
jgi:hypothetical protein